MEQTNFNLTYPSNDSSIEYSFEKPLSNSFHTSDNSSPQNISDSDSDSDKKSIVHFRYLKRNVQVSQTRSFYYQVPNSSILKEYQLNDSNFAEFLTESTNYLLIDVTLSQAKQNLEILFSSNNYQFSLKNNQKFNPIDFDLSDNFKDIIRLIFETSMKSTSLFELIIQTLKKPNSLAKKWETIFSEYFFSNQKNRQQIYDLMVNIEFIYIMCKTKMIINLFTDLSYEKAISLIHQVCKSLKEDTKEQKTCQKMIKNILANPPAGLPMLFFYVYDGVDELSENSKLIFKDLEQHIRESIQDRDKILKNCADHILQTPLKPFKILKKLKDAKDIEKNENFINIISNFQVHFGIDADFKMIPFDVHVVEGKKYMQNEIKNILLLTPIDKISFVLDKIWGSKNEKEIIDLFIQDKQMQFSLTKWESFSLLYPKYLIKIWEFENKTIEMHQINDVLEIYMQSSEGKDSLPAIFKELKQSKSFFWDSPWLVRKALMVCSECLSKEEKMEAIKIWADQIIKHESEYLNFLSDLSRSPEIISMILKEIFNKDEVLYLDLSKQNKIPKENIAELSENEVKRLFDKIYNSENCGNYGQFLTNLNESHKNNFYDFLCNKPPSQLINRIDIDQFEPRKIKFHQNYFDEFADEFCQNFQHKSNPEAIKTYFNRIIQKFEESSKFIKIMCRKAWGFPSLRKEMFNLIYKMELKPEYIDENAILEDVYTEILKKKVLTEEIHKFYNYYNFSKSKEKFLCAWDEGWKVPSNREKFWKFFQKNLLPFEYFEDSQLKGLLEFIFSQSSWTKDIHEILFLTQKKIRDKGFSIVFNEYPGKFLQSLPMVDAWNKTKGIKLTLSNEKQIKHIIETIIEIMAIDPIKNDELLDLIFNNIEKIQERELVRQEIQQKIFNIHLESKNKINILKPFIIEKKKFLHFFNDKSNTETFICQLKKFELLDSEFIHSLWDELQDKKLNTDHLFDSIRTYPLLLLQIPNLITEMKSKKFKFKKDDIDTICTNFEVCLKDGDESWLNRAQNLVDNYKDEYLCVYQQIFKKLWESNKFNMELVDCLAQKKLNYAILDTIDVYNLVTFICPNILNRKIGFTTYEKMVKSLKGDNRSLFLDETIKSHVRFCLSSDEIVSLLTNKEKKFSKDMDITEIKLMYEEMMTSETAETVGEKCGLLTKRLDALESSKSISIKIFNDLFDIHWTKKEYQQKLVSIIPTNCYGQEFFNNRFPEFHGKNDRKEDLFDFLELYEIDSLIENFFDVLFEKDPYFLIENKKYLKRLSELKKEFQKEHIENLKKRCEKILKSEEDPINFFTDAKNLIDLEVSKEWSTKYIELYKAIFRPSWEICWDTSKFDLIQHLLDKDISAEILEEKHLEEIVNYHYSKSEIKNFSEFMQLLQSDQKNVIIKTVKLNYTAKLLKNNDCIYTWMIDNNIKIEKDEAIAFENLAKFFFNMIEKNEANEFKEKSTKIEKLVDPLLIFKKLWESLCQAEENKKVSNFDFFMKQVFDETISAKLFDDKVIDDYVNHRIRLEKKAKYIEEIELLYKKIENRSLLIKSSINNYPILYTTPKSSNLIKLANSLLYQIEVGNKKLNQVISFIFSKYEKVVLNTAQSTNVNTCIENLKQICGKDDCAWKILGEVFSELYKIRHKNMDAFVEFIWKFLKNYGKILIKDELFCKSLCVVCLELIGNYNEKFKLVAEVFESLTAADPEKMGNFIKNFYSFENEIIISPMSLLDLIQKITSGCKKLKHSAAKNVADDLTQRLLKALNSNNIKLNKFDHFLEAGNFKSYEQNNDTSDLLIKHLPPFLQVKLISMENFFDNKSLIFDKISSVFVMRVLAKTYFNLFFEQPLNDERVILKFLQGLIYVKSITFHESLLQMVEILRKKGEKCLSISYEKQVKATFSIEYFENEANQLEERKSVLNALNEQKPPLSSFYNEIIKFSDELIASFIDNKVTIEWLKNSEILYQNWGTTKITNQNSKTYDLKKNSENLNLAFHIQPLFKLRKLVAQEKIGSLLQEYYKLSEEIINEYNLIKTNFRLPTEFNNNLCGCGMKAIEGCEKFLYQDTENIQKARIEWKKYLRIFNYLQDCRKSCIFRSFEKLFFNDLLKNVSVFDDLVNRLDEIRSQFTKWTNELFQSTLYTLQTQNLDFTSIIIGEDAKEDSIKEERIKKEISLLQNEIFLKLINRSPQDINKLIRIISNKRNLVDAYTNTKNTKEIVEIFLPCKYIIDNMYFSNNFAEKKCLFDIPIEELYLNIDNHAWEENTNKKKVSIYSGILKARNAEKLIKFVNEFEKDENFKKLRVTVEQKFIEVEEEVKGQDFQSEANLNFSETDVQILNNIYKACSRVKENKDLITFFNELKGLIVQFPTFDECVDKMNKDIESLTKLMTGKREKENLVLEKITIILNKEKPSQFCIDENFSISVECNFDAVLKKIENEYKVNEGEDAELQDETVKKKKMEEKENRIKFEKEKHLFSYDKLQRIYDIIKITQNPNESNLIISEDKKLKNDFQHLFNNMQQIIQGMQNLKGKGGHIKDFNKNKKMEILQPDLLDRFLMKIQNDLGDYEKKLNEMAAKAFHELNKDEGRQLYRYVVKDAIENEIKLSAEKNSIARLKHEHLLRMISPGANKGMLKENYQDEETQFFDFYKCLSNEERPIPKDMKNINHSSSFKQLNKVTLTFDIENGEIIETLCSYFILIGKLVLPQNLFLIEEHTSPFTIEHFFRKASQLNEHFFMILTNQWSNEGAHSNKINTILDFLEKHVTKDFQGNIILIMPGQEPNIFKEKCKDFGEVKLKNDISVMKQDKLKDFIKKNTALDEKIETCCYTTSRAGDGKSFEIRKLANTNSLLYKELTIGAEINFTTILNRIFKHLVNSEKDILLNLTIGHPPSWKKGDISVFHSHFSIFVFSLLVLGGYRAEEGCLLINCPGNEWSIKNICIKSIQLEKKNVVGVGTPEILKYLKEEKVEAFLREKDWEPNLDKIDFDPKNLDSKFIMKDSQIANITLHACLHFFFNACHTKSINGQPLIFPCPGASTNDKNYTDSNKQNSAKTDFINYLKEYIWKIIKENTSQDHFKNLNIKKFFDILLLLYYELQAFNESSILGQDLLKYGIKFQRIKEYRMQVIENLIKQTLMFCFSSVSDYDTIQKFTLKAAQNDFKDDDTESAKEEFQNAIKGVQNNYIKFDSIDLILLKFTKQQNIYLIYRKKSESKLSKPIREAYINQQIFLEYMTEKRKVFDPNQKEPQNQVQQFVLKFKFAQEKQLYLEGKNESINELNQKIKPLEDFKSNDLWEMLADIYSLGAEEVKKQKENFTLTKDIFLKIIMISSKLKAKLPVIVIGDTGTGKTMITNFISEVILPNFQTAAGSVKTIYRHIMIHAGRKENDISEEIENIIQEAKEKSNYLFAIFLDEFNTSSAIDLLTELLVDKKLFGELLPSNLYVMGACNPFIHDDTADEQKEILSNRTEEDNALVKTKVGNKTIYSVFPISEIILGYLLDFGSLQTEEENQLIRFMVKKSFKKFDGKMKGNELEDDDYDQFSDAISFCQEYVRNAYHKNYVVSIRDIKRFNELFVFFVLEYFPKKLQFQQDFYQKNNQEKNELDMNSQNDEKKIKLELANLNNTMWVIIQSFILSIMIGYCLRLQSYSKRDNFLKKFQEKLKNFHRIIYMKDIDVLGSFNKEANFIINNLQSNIAFISTFAINKPLRENIFALFTCLMANIPILLCGKPGCSKTLSKNLLIHNCKGKDSPSDFFTEFPKLVTEYFQGSESSTSETVEKAFKDARYAYKKAREQRAEKMIPILIIDELGLAEVSKNNPLKVLHLYLDNPNQPGRGNEENEPCIGFLGISNWQLDAAKNNRAVFITRPNLDSDDLKKIGTDISEKVFKDKNITLCIVDEKCEDKTKYYIEEYDKVIEFLADSYKMYLHTHLKENPFHGPRDYYALMKSIANSITKYLETERKSEIELKKLVDIIILKISRNFSGLLLTVDKKEDHSRDVFIKDMSKIKPNGDLTERVQYYIQEQKDKLPTTRDIIKDYLYDIESRYVMIINEEQSAFDAIKEFIIKETQNMIDQHNKGAADKKKYSSVQLLERPSNDLVNFKIKSDLELLYQYMYNGDIVIMYNYNELYTSLYELFNMVRRKIGGKTLCEVAFENIQKKDCEINDDFRVIVVVDHENVPKEDAPLLNRFEKYLARWSDLMNESQISESDKVELLLKFNKSNSSNFLISESRLLVCATTINLKRIYAKAKYMDKRVFRLLPIEWLLHAVYQRDQANNTESQNKLADFINRFIEKFEFSKNKFQDVQDIIDGMNKNKKSKEKTIFKSQIHVLVSFKYFSSDFVKSLQNVCVITNIDEKDSENLRSKYNVALKVINDESIFESELATIRKMENIFKNIIVMIKIRYSKLELNKKICEFLSKDYKITILQDADNNLLNAINSQNITDYVIRDYPGRKLANLFIDKISKIQNEISSKGGSNKSEQEKRKKINIDQIKNNLECLFDNPNIREFLMEGLDIQEKWVNAILKDSKKYSQNHSLNAIIGSYIEDKINLESIYKKIEILFTVGIAQTLHNLFQIKNKFEASETIDRLSENMIKIMNDFPESNSSINLPLQSMKLPFISKYFAMNILSLLESDEDQMHNDLLQCGKNNCENPKSSSEIIEIDKLCKQLFENFPEESNDRQLIEDNLIYDIFVLIKINNRLQTDCISEETARNHIEKSFFSPECDNPYKSIDKFSINFVYGLKFYIYSRKLYQGYIEITDGQEEVSFKKMVFNYQSPFKPYYIDIFLRKICLLLDANEPNLAHKLKHWKIIYKKSIHFFKENEQLSECKAYLNVIKIPLYALVELHSKFIAPDKIKNSTSCMKKLQEDIEKYLKSKGENIAEGELKKILDSFLNTIFKIEPNLLHFKVQSIIKDLKKCNEENRFETYKEVVEWVSNHMKEENTEMLNEILQKLIKINGSYNITNFNIENNIFEKANPNSIEFWRYFKVILEKKLQKNEKNFESVWTQCSTNASFWSNFIKTFNLKEASHSASTEAASVIVCVHLNSILKPDLNDIFAGKKEASQTETKKLKNNLQFLNILYPKIQNKVHLEYFGCLLVHFLNKNNIQTENFIQFLSDEGFEYRFQHQRSPQNKILPSSYASSNNLYFQAFGDKNFNILNMLSKNGFDFLELCQDIYLQNMFSEEGDFLKNSLTNLNMHNLKSPINDQIKFAKLLACEMKKEECKVMNCDKALNNKEIYFRLSLIINFITVLNSRECIFNNIVDKDKNLLDIEKLGKTNIPGALSAQLIEYLKINLIDTVVDKKIWASKIGSNINHTKYSSRCFKAYYCKKCKKIVVHSLQEAQGKKLKCSCKEKLENDNFVYEKEFWKNKFWEDCFTPGVNIDMLNPTFLMRKKISVFDVDSKSKQIVNEKDFWLMPYVFYFFVARTYYWSILIFGALLRKDWKNSLSAKFGIDSSPNLIEKLYTRAAHDFEGLLLIFSDKPEYLYAYLCSLGKQICNDKETKVTNFYDFLKTKAEDDLKILPNALENKDAKIIEKNLADFKASYSQKNCMKISKMFASLLEDHKDEETFKFLLHRLVIDEEKDPFDSIKGTKNEFLLNFYYEKVKQQAEELEALVKCYNLSKLVLKTNIDASDVETEFFEYIKKDYSEKYEKFKEIYERLVVFNGQEEKTYPKNPKLFEILPIKSMIDKNVVVQRLKILLHIQNDYVLNYLEQKPTIPICGIHYKKVKSGELAATISNLREKFNMLEKKIEKKENTIDEEREYFKLKIELNSLPEDPSKIGIHIKNVTCEHIMHLKNLPSKQRIIYRSYENDKNDPFKYNCDRKINENRLEDWCNQVKESIFSGKEIIDVESLNEIYGNINNAASRNEKEKVKVIKDDFVSNDLPNQERVSLNSNQMNLLIKYLNEDQDEEKDILDIKKLPKILIEIAKQIVNEYIDSQITVRAYINSHWSGSILAKLFEEEEFKNDFTANQLKFLYYEIVTILQSNNTYEKYNENERSSTIRQIYEKMEQNQETATVENLIYAIALSYQLNGESSKDSVAAIFLNVFDGDIENISEIEEMEDLELLMNEYVMKKI